MAVDETLDTGDVYRRAEVPIGDRATAAELRANLVDVGTRLLVDVLAGDLPTPEPQVGEPSVRGEAHARRVAPRLVERRRAGGPLGARRRLVDDVPR